MTRKLTSIEYSNIKYQYVASWIVITTVISFVTLMPSKQGYQVTKPYDHMETAGTKHVAIT